MSSTVSSGVSASDQPPLPPRWRSWPLVDCPRWSWLAPVGVLGIAGGVAHLSTNWWPGLVAAACLSAALWQFFVPVRYEVDALGIRRHALGRTRMVPWQAIRAYQPRATGVVLFQRPDPTAIDALRGLFIPYGEDDDETLCTVREHLRHAVELPII